MQDTKLWDAIHAGKNAGKAERYAEDRLEELKSLGRENRFILENIVACYEIAAEYAEKAGALVSADVYKREANMYDKILKKVKEQQDRPLPDYRSMDLDYYRDIKND